MTNANDTTIARLVSTLRDEGRMTDREVLAAGFTASQLDAAIREGLVRITGTDRGAVVTRYLVAA